MTLGLSDEIVQWVLGFLGTVAFSLIVYFLKENISTLKELNKIIASFRTEFEVHKNEDKHVVSDVEILKKDMKDVQKEHVEFKLRLGEISTKLKH